MPKTNNENKQTPLKQTTVAPAPKKRAPASTLPGPAANANSSNVTKRKALSRLTYPHHPRLKNDIPRSEANGKASLMNVTSTKDADKETGKDFDFFSYNGFLPPGHDPWLYFCHSSYQHQPFYAVSADIWSNFLYHKLWHLCPSHICVCYFVVLLLTESWMMSSRCGRILFCAEILKNYWHLIHVIIYLYDTASRKQTQFRRLSFSYILYYKIITVCV